MHAYVRACLRQEPYKLPEGFGWCEVDMNDAAEAKEAYDLLNRNYVEDDDNMFRFDYSPAFLEWALTPPGHRLEFVVGIRVAPKKKDKEETEKEKKDGPAKKGKLVGFITGVPVDMRVYDKTVRGFVRVWFRVCACVSPCVRVSACVCVCGWAIGRVGCVGL
jgi:glycylpeptide N-tetradecanoyltransferase